MTEEKRVAFIKPELYEVTLQRLRAGSVTEPY
jgi:hypothetical protein